MKINFGFLIFCSTVIIFSCNLERIEPGTGNETKFQTTIGGNANEFQHDIIVNADGSFVIVGNTQSFTADNNNDAYIVKLNKTGQQEWEKNYGGNADDDAYAVVGTSDGGYVFCGKTKSSNPNFNDDLYIVKVNAQGNPVWTKSYGAPDSTEVGFGVCAVGTSDFLVGYTSDFIGSGTQIRFLRINSNGSRISNILGATGNFFISQMIKTSDNKIVIVGSEFTNSTTTYTAKFMEDGHMIWHKNYSGTIENYAPGRGVVEMPDKNLVVAGSYLGDNDHDFNIVIYSEAGMQLNFTNEGGGANADELLAITGTKDGEVVVLGYSGSFSTTTEIYLSKRKKTDGSIIWAKHFGNNTDSDASVKLCPDGGFVICKNQNQSNADIEIYKTNADGEYQ